MARIPKVDTRCDPEQKSHPAQSIFLLSRVLVLSWPLFHLFVLHQSRLPPKVSLFTSDKAVIFQHAT